MQCPHLAGLGPIPAKTEGCEECLRHGTEWVHLRLCLTCGHVGCCDSSPGQHASKHSHKTQHPVIASFEIGERWVWCFPEELDQPVPARFEAVLR